MSVAPPDDVAEPIPNPATIEEQLKDPGGRQRFRWLREHLRFTLPGCWGALILACLSFTPSLLPRGGFLQGLICGIDAAIGYGLGVLAAAIWRSFANRDARPPRRWAWRTFAISAAVLLVLFFGLGQYWQHEIRQLMGVTDYNIPWAIASPFVAFTTFWLLLALGRWLRALYRRTARALNRHIGQRAAKTVGWLLVATATYLVVSGLLLDGMVNIANQAFSLRNGETPEGIHQPTTDLRSGGPGSVIPWGTLGRQGRKFVATGPTATQIESLTHHTAAPNPHLRGPRIRGLDGSACRPCCEGPRPRRRLPAQGPSCRDDDR